MTIAISSDNAEVTVSPTSLTFTDSNWNTPQEVIITIDQDDDAVDDTAAITHTVTGTGDYAGITVADTPIIVLDDDEAGVTVSPTTLTISEGGDATYTVVLTSEPTEDVTVTVSGYANTDATVSPSILTFSDSNWSQQQTVTVIAAEDDIDKGDSNEVTLTHALTTTAAEYGSVTAEDVVVTLTDDDTAGAFTTPIGNLPAYYDEGDTEQYFLQLSSQPTADVTIAISTDNADVTVSPTNLTFTESNWNTYQQVTFTIAHDSDIDDDDATISHTLTGTGEYSGITGPSVALVVSDDDNELSITADSSSVEEGDEAVFTLRRAGNTHLNLHVAVDIAASGQAVFILPTEPKTEQTGLVNFSTGEATTQLHVPTVDNKVIGGTGQITVEINDSAGDSDFYTADSAAASATINVTDNDNDNDADAQWDLSLTGTTINEGESETVTVAISNGYTFADTQDVKLHWDGQSLVSFLWLMLRGATDFATLTLPAEEPSVSATLTYTEDDSRTVFNTGDTGIATAPLQAHRGNQYIGNQVNVTIVDNEPLPLITITAPSTALEGDSFDLQILSNTKAGFSIRASFGYTDPGSALKGPTTATVNIPAHRLPSDPVIVPVSTSENKVDAEHKTVTITLTDARGPSGHEDPDGDADIGSPASVTITIVDDDDVPGPPDDLEATAATRSPT